MKSGIAFLVAAPPQAGKFSSMKPLLLALSLVFPLAALIARPLSTKDSAEKGTLSNLSPLIGVTGCSTKFETRTVMKGDKATNRRRTVFSV